MREGNSLLNKICPVCETQFTTKVVDRVFCTVRCRSQAHREREKLRDGPRPDALEAAMYFSAPVTNPTLEFIVRVADLMVIAKTEKPMLFRGAMPQVDLSKMKVSLQPSANPAEWIMFYDENSGRDVLEILNEQTHSSN